MNRQMDLRLRISGGLRPHGQRRMIYSSPPFRFFWPRYHAAIAPRIGTLGFLGAFDGMADDLETAFIPRHWCGLGKHTVSGEIDYAATQGSGGFTVPWTCRDDALGFVRSFLTDQSLRHPGPTGPKISFSSPNGELWGHFFGDEQNQKLTFRFCSRNGTLLAECLSSLGNQLVSQWTTADDTVRCAA